MRTETYTYKSKGAAIVWGLLLGGMGIHRFYLGYTALGFAFVIAFVLLVLTPLFWVPGVAAIIDIIMIAGKDQEYFKRLSGYTETAPQADQA